MERERERPHLRQPLRPELRVRNPRDLRWSGRIHNRITDPLDFSVGPAGEYSNSFSPPDDGSFGGSGENDPFEGPSPVHLPGWSDARKLVFLHKMGILAVDEKVQDDGSQPVADPLTLLSRPMTHCADLDWAPPVKTVPAKAEQVLFFLYPPDRLDAVVGDMEELFHIAGAKHGYGYARWWYWWQLARHAFERLLSLGERLSKMVSPFKGG